MTTRQMPLLRRGVTELLLWLLLYGLRYHALLTGRTTFTGDGGYTFRYFYHVISSLAAGNGLPLWNPYLNCGEPFYFTHAFLGTCGPLVALAAVPAAIWPDLPVSICFSVVLIVTLAVCTWLCSGLIRRMTGNAGAALTVALVLYAMPVIGSDVLVPLQFMLGMTALLLWWRLTQTGTPALLYLLAAVLAVMFGQLYLAVRELLLAIFMLGGVHWWLTVRRGGTWRLPAWRHRVLATGVLLLALLPHGVIAADAWGNVVRLGRRAPPQPAVWLPSAEHLGELGGELAGLLAFPFDSKPLLLNPLVVFIPWLWRRRRGETLLHLWLPVALCLCLGIPLARGLLDAWLPVRGLELRWYPATNLLAALALIAGGGGFAAYCRGLALRRPVSGFAGVHLGTLIWILAEFMLFDGEQRPTGAALLVPASLAAHYLVLYLLPPGCRVWRVLMLTLPLVAATADNLAPRTAAVPADPLMLSGVRQYGADTPRVDDGWEEPPEYIDLERASRPILTGELYAYGPTWRTRNYDDWLHQVPAAERRYLMRVGRSVAGFVGEQAGGDTAAGAEACSVIGRSADELLLRPDASLGGTLLIADTYHRGWQAECEQGTLQVLPAAGVFKMLVVPPATRSIRLHFEMPLVRAALWGGIVAPAVLLLAAAVSVRRYRGGLPG